MGSLRALRSVPACLSALSAACLLASCQATVEAQNPTGDISYFRDNRTGLCFAAVSSMGAGGYRTVSITEVPCEKVEAFL